MHDVRYTMIFLVARGRYIGVSPTTHMESLKHREQRHLAAKLSSFKVAYIKQTNKYYLFNYLEMN